MQLLKFELRKILLSKITILAFILLLGINIFNVAQDIVRSIPYNDYDRLQRQIEHVHAIAGEITEERLEEIEAEREAFINDPANQIPEEEIYQHAKEDMDRVLAEVADNPEYYSEEDIAEMSDISFWLGMYMYDEPERRLNEQAKNSLEWERITNQYQAMNEANGELEIAFYRMNEPDGLLFSDDESEVVKEKWRELCVDYMEHDDFVIDYNEGWRKFVESSHQYFPFLLGFIIAIGIASLFAVERSHRTDALILSSKYGKSKVIAAKVLAGFCFTFAAWFVFELVNAIIVFSVFGFFGADSTLLIYGRVPYFMTYLQIALITLGETLLAALYLSAIVMLVSTLTKSRIVSLLIGAVLIIQPYFPFLNFNDMVTNMMPGSLLSAYHSMWYRFEIYDVFGTAVPKCDVSLIAMAVVVLMCVVISYITFRRWQVKN